MENDSDPLATQLEADLAGAPDLDRRIHDFYLPVFHFCVSQIRSARRRPVLIGVQAPQGAGKTTLVTHLLKLLPLVGLRGAGVSIDDFYLTRDEQLRVAAAHPDNPYLEHRGYPGTHDIDLGEQALAALRHLASAEAAAVRVPVYDKSAHGGRGDRKPASEWREVTGPLDVVLVEGWMLGFRPVSVERLDDPRLAEPNRALAEYERWLRQLDALVWIRAAEPTFVLKWRVQAEEAMKARGLPGLSREAIEDYIGRFLPAYALYVAGTATLLPPERMFTLVLDEQRRPVPAGPLTEVTIPVR